jgi:hypothetical protein
LGGSTALTPTRLRSVKTSPSTASTVNRPPTAELSRKEDAELLCREPSEQRSAKQVCEDEDDEESRSRDAGDAENPSDEWSSSPRFHEEAAAAAGTIATRPRA